MKTYEIGFDTTSFESEYEWLAILAVFGMPIEANRNPANCNAFQWKNDSITIETSNNPITGEYYNPGQRTPERGFVGYIGATSNNKTVIKLFEKLVEYLADHIKDKSPNSRDYI